MLRPSFALTFLLCCAALTASSQAPENIVQESHIYAIAPVSVVGQRTFKPLGEDSLQLVAEIRAMLKSDQKYRSNKREFGAHMAEQRAIDSLNTLRMMEIIRTYGFPSNARFPRSADPMLPHIVLVHAPEHFFDTLRPMLEKEHEAGRMTPNEYAHIRWHLDGRKSHPVMQGGTTRYKKGGKKMVHRTTPKTRSKGVF